MNLLNTSESFPSFPLARYYPGPYSTTVVASLSILACRFRWEGGKRGRANRESLLLLIALPITPCSRCRAAYEEDWGLVSSYPLGRQYGIIASILRFLHKREINAYRLIRTKKNRVAIKIKTDNPPPIPPASNPTGIPAKRERFSQKQTHMFKSNARKLSMNSVKNF